MESHPVVSHQQWLEARKALLAKEKEFSRLRDELTEQRRRLPWEKVEKNYEFQAPEGKVTLAELFGKCSQLIVYHFMFDPDWDEGCKSCSLCADHYAPSIAHLQARDVSLVTVSRAPLTKLEAFRQRMGWDFRWVSSLDSDFNWDYHVSFTPDQLETGQMDYNYSTQRGFPVTEAPGISSFIKDDEGAVFHAYSSFARGLETFLPIYNLLDIVPKGRDEDALPYGMAWVRHHDRYGDDTFVDPYVDLATDGQ